MYAIIETGGKQYRVQPGDILSIEKLSGQIGELVNFDKVLLIGGKSNDQTLIGKPYVTQAITSAEIVEQTRGDKLLTIKYRRRKGYRRTIGHRQDLTRILITKIADGAGDTQEFDASKRKEVLIKASVKFSDRKERRAKASAAKTTDAPATTKTKSTKAASATKAKTAKKKA